MLLMQMAMLVLMLLSGYRKSSIKPPGGAYLFQAHLRGGGGLIETGGLFNLKTTMVSVLHKELDCKVEKLKHKKF